METKKNQTKFILYGNIVRDLHVGKTAEGVTVVNFIIAYDNTNSRKTVFMPIRAWGSIAQAMIRLDSDNKRLVRKGTYIRLEVDPNTDSKLIDSQPKNFLVFEVKEFTILSQSSKDLIPG